MKKAIVAVAAVGCWALVLSPVAGAGPGDSVHGGGTVPPTATACDNHFAVNARSGPSGESPDGILHYTSADCGRFFNAEVVCVRVVGNQATVLAEFRNDDRGDPAFEGGGLLAFYEDNGNPSGGQTPDRQQNSRLTATQFAIQKALGCPPPIVPRTQLQSGNLVIRDN